MLYPLVFLKSGVVISSREIEGDADDTTLFYENKILEGELKVPSGCDEIHFNRKFFDLLPYPNGYDARLIRTAKTDIKTTVYTAEPKKRGRPAKERETVAPLVTTEGEPVVRRRGRPPGSKNKSKM